MAVYAGDYSGFSLGRITAPGGNGATGSHRAPDGGPGTVYLKALGYPFGQLVCDAVGVGNGWGILGLPWTNLVVVADNVVVRGNLTRVMPEHAGLVVEFQTNVWVTGAGQLSVVGSNVVFGGSLTVDENGVVSVAGDLALTGPLAVISSGQLNVSGALCLVTPLTLTGGGTVQVSGSVTSAVPVTV